MIYFLIGLFVGSLICYLVLHKKLTAVIKLDEETSIQNQQIQKENNDLLISNKQLKNEKQNIKESIDNLNNLLANYNKNLDDTRKKADEMADEIYQNRVKSAEDKAKEKEKDFQKAEEEYQNEYSQLMEDLTLHFQDLYAQNKEKISKLEEIFLDLSNKTAAAVEANKRAELSRTEKDFYRLVLSEQDIAEIKRLREVTSYLRNPETLNKVIWKAYYEKPCTDLIGRVIGNQPKTGIYKITNLQNEMCYVGQAANLAERWKQHVKRGIGADPPTRNKLYPAMLAIGVENFTFEIIEECTRDQLNEKEKYWTDYFHAQEFGYSIRKG